MSFVPGNMLITGAAGFAGSHFLNSCYNHLQNNKIIMIDKLDYNSRMANIDDEVNEHVNFKFIRMDISNYEFLLHILQEYNIDTVVNFASLTHVDNSFQNSLEFTRNNVIGVHTILEACRIYGKIKKIIEISTDEVFGEAEMSDEQEQAKSEKSMLIPTNPYASSKASQDMLCMSYINSYKMPIIIVRCNNFIGPKQFPDKLIPKFIILLLTGNKCPIQGSGESLRTFVHVDDLCNALHIILKKELMVKFII